MFGEVAVPLEALEPRLEPDDRLLVLGASRSLNCSSDMSAEDGDAGLRSTGEVALEFDMEDPIFMEPSRRRRPVTRSLDDCRGIACCMI